MKGAFCLAAVAASMMAAQAVTVDGNWKIVVPPHETSGLSLSLRKCAESFAMAFRESTGLDLKVVAADKATNGVPAI